MTETRSRKRQPDLTQQKLLEVAGELVNEMGVAALTLDAVAKRAGVSKGGLLHHFPSKAALLAAMVEDLSGRFFDGVATRAAADPDPHGRSARAYIRTAADEAVSDQQRWGALSAAFLSDPLLLDGWRARLAGLRAVDQDESADPVGALVARLAADGLWFADVCRLHAIDGDTRRLVVERLLSMTKTDAGEPRR